MVRKFKRIHASMLKLEVTSGDSCVLLPVLKLSLFCHIEVPDDVANYQYMGHGIQKKNYI